jgi:hypothetical protein
MGAGLERLLLRERTFDVYGIVAESVSSLVLTINQLQPHVIFLDGHLSTVSVKQLRSLLPQPYDPDLIEINVNTPYMRILTKKQIWLTRPVSVTNVIDWLTHQDKKSIHFLLKEAASI